MGHKRGFDALSAPPADPPDDERCGGDAEHDVFEFSYGCERASETAQHRSGDLQGDGAGWRPKGCGEKIYCFRFAATLTTVVVITEAFL